MLGVITVVKSRRRQVRSLNQAELAQLARAGIRDALVPLLRSRPFNLKKVGRKVKLKLTILLACLLAGPAFAVNHAHGGLGCGTIVSLRESTQEPVPSEVQDDYRGPRRSGGTFFQILRVIPGVGAVAAVAGEVVADVAISTISANAQAADRAKQAAAQKYDDVQAVEFRFDDGVVINMPVYVVSGMRYKVGTRLNAMISPKYRTVALSLNPLFGGVPDVGDKDYNVACRIDDPQARAEALEPMKHLVDEAQIVDPKERRQVEAAAPKAEDVVSQ